jgi:hypothetical protein
LLLWLLLLLLLVLVLVLVLVLLLVLLLELCLRLLQTHLPREHEDLGLEIRRASLVRVLVLVLCHLSRQRQRQRLRHGHGHGKIASRYRVEVRGHGGALHLLCALVQGLLHPRWERRVGRGSGSAGGVTHDRLRLSLLLCPHSREKAWVARQAVHATHCGGVPLRHAVRDTVRG